MIMYGMLTEKETSHQNRVNSEQQTSPTMITTSLKLNARLSGPVHQCGHCWVDKKNAAKFHVRQSNKIIRTKTGFPSYTIFAYEPWSTFTYGLRMQIIFTCISYNLLMFYLCFTYDSLMIYLYSTYAILILLMTSLCKPCLLLQLFIYLWFTNVWLMIHLWFTYDSLCMLHLALNQALNHTLGILLMINLWSTYSTYDLLMQIMFTCMTYDLLMMYLWFTYDLLLIY